MIFPSPAALKAEFPLCADDHAFIEDSRHRARAIVSGEDSSLAIIVGPCSIHRTEEAIEYAKRLSRLSTQVEQSAFLVMRVYVEKSRTGVGWKGLLYDPHLDGSEAIEEGLRASRSLFLE